MNIDNVLSPHRFKRAFYNCFKNVAGVSFKYHKLEALHAWNDQYKFLGPILFQNTKRFEQFNGVLKHISQHSNHRDPATNKMSKVIINSFSLAIKQQD